MLRILEPFAEARRAAANLQPPPQLRRLAKIGTRCKQPNPSWIKHVANQAYTLVKVLASPRVDDATQTARMAECHACPHVTIAGKLHYCQCCGCPKWSGLSEGSDLEHKNRHAAHACPRDPPAFGPA